MVGDVGVAPVHRYPLISLAVGIPASICVVCAPGSAMLSQKVNNAPCRAFTKDPPRSPRPPPPPPPPLSPFRALGHVA